MQKENTWIHHDTPYNGWVGTCFVAKWNHEYPPSKLKTITAPNFFFEMVEPQVGTFGQLRCQADTITLPICPIRMPFGQANRLSCFFQAKDFSLELHCLPQPLNNDMGHNRVEFRESDHWNLDSHFQGHFVGVFPLRTPHRSRGLSAWLMLFRRLHDPRNHGALTIRPSPRRSGDDISGCLEWRFNDLDVQRWSKMLLVSI